VANSLITPTLVVRRAIQLFRNANPFLQMIDRQWEDQFGNPSVAGQKPGSQIAIRLPNDYVLRSGPTASPQNTTEVTTTLTVAKQVGVDISFSYADRTLTMQDYSQRVIEPAVNTIVNGIAADIFASVIDTIPNIVHNVDGSNNTISPTLTTFATAGALLDKLSTPRGQRNVILDPVTMARTVSSFSGLFNQQSKIGDQYETAMIKKDVLGMDWAQDANLPTHTVGTATIGNVSGGSQTGSSITVASVGSGGLKKGDIITFAGVYSVNRASKTSTGQLAQFVVTSNVSATASPVAVPIYPALTPTPAGSPVAYGTVTASPANGAAVTAINNATEVYRKNFIFHPLAFTLAMVPMEMPTRGVVEAYRESYQGCSLRLITFYDGTNDQSITRLDALYGVAAVRPEWACIVADAL
jgi:hypothetical protein